MPRLVAFYLPQFHPIAENDAWWGEGFTEWRHVREARSLFPGHGQPRLPGELGYYDLRDSRVREEQARLAREHGIDAFCYYHYWFEGKRLLGGPLTEMAASGRPDFPFCLCWANESWTRAWDGRRGEVLIRQTYSPQDDFRHIRWLLPLFADARYLRLDGRPLFLVYRAGRLPDPRRTTDLWREEARRAGVGEPYLVRVESFSDERGDPAALGFDAAVEFHPDWRLLGPSLWLRSLRRHPRAWPLALSGHRLFDYDLYVERARGKGRPPYRRFPCVLPGWDNSPRRRRGAVILAGSGGGAYEGWLREARAAERELVFLNAWNEWGEGSQLEPDGRDGRALLEATRRAAGRAP